MIAQIDSLFDMMAAFPDEQSCLDHLQAIRWQDGEFCPHCGGMRVYHFSDRKTFKCGDCRQRFSIKVGTIFEDTKLPLRKWFMAIWMITNHPKGIASTTLAKDLKVTQKTAWFILHRLRHASTTKSFNAPLKGTVEADTTFVGGKEKNKHSNDGTGGTQGGAGKEVVLGILEREGELRASHVPDHKGGTLKGAVRENVAAGSTVMTDEDRSFKGLDKDIYHHAVNHSAGEYVHHYTIHTNGIESIWALLKRQIIGVHHWVSPKHLDRYVQEMTWRFNRRDMRVGARLNDMFSCVEGRLTYKELIA
ncbi:IS1595 family transposase [Pannonibacter sp. SL95]|uniref:IS1595 family transposase n=1 Tax=Pannonibacter sp. SL95 TaxID=2995153 RepID=UPI0022754EDA|nr:IS1595 family transposase [Pannonibacter sp. SL95]MCY1704567.1 IS1595 family transposase [Pannonibacter sp. SL95]